MKHIELQIVANEFQQEELIALLDDYSPTGFVQTDEMLTAYFEEDNFPTDAITQILVGYQYKKKELEEQNWNIAWEQSFQPVIVEDFCAVRAHFHQPLKSVKHELIITPKMSFGTGHHATTYLMMQQMRDIDFCKKTVFDFGTGTGILAILAEKLGAENIIGIDIDDWSINNAIENIANNNCSNVSVSLSSNLPQKRFDIVLANINRNVLVDYMEQLAAILNSKGLLLLSGLMVADETIITGSAKRNALELRNRCEKEGWISLLFVNNG